MKMTRLVRYADDLVVLCRYNVHRTYGRLAAVLESLGLTLSTEKTRVVDATHEGFTFLGFTLRMVKSPRTGKLFPLIVPSKKALSRIKKEIKDATCRKNLARPNEVTVARLNMALRGWVNYFYYMHCTKAFAHLKNYTEERVRVYLSRKHRLRGRGYTKYPNAYLYENLWALQNTDYRSMGSGCESRWKKMIGKPYSGTLQCAEGTQTERTV